MGFNGVNFLDVSKIAIAIMVCVVVITIGAIIIVWILKASKTSVTNQQLLEYNSYKELANELKETNKEMRKELVDLTEKVSSIEKILKEVE
jgi:uncharacterized protein YlxW (UPF0749 family)